jgi:hypothetical protein
VDPQAFEKMVDQSKLCAQLPWPQQLLGEAWKGAGRPSEMKIKEGEN